MPSYQNKLHFQSIALHFPHYRKPLLSEYDRWRYIAKEYKLSRAAHLRLEWIIYRHQGHSVALTCRHFGIARKTYYKWACAFDPDNIQTLHLLEDRSRRPKKTRIPIITSVQEMRIVSLRKEYMQYGKMKLAKLYFFRYGEYISTNHIQKTIQKYKLYPKPKKKESVQTKRKRSLAIRKKRVTELKLVSKKWFEGEVGSLLCLDTIEIRHLGKKRYIFTAVDRFGKFGYARMYLRKTSLNAKDFLKRLIYLLDGHTFRVGHDNGSEFAKHFRTACESLGIEQYYSRVRTPKDNACNERFNKTIQGEFITYKGFDNNPEIFNPLLTEWLIEYNFIRPHEALDYQTPMQVCKVLPMYASCTDG